MSLKLHTTYKIMWEDKEHTAWSIPEHFIYQADGKDFIKIVPTWKKFVKLVCEGFVDCSAANPSLCRALGFLKLLELRNDAQRRFLTKETESERESNLSRMFAGSEPTSKRFVRTSVKAREAARETQKTMELQLEGHGTVVIVRPVDPTDNLVIEFKVGAIESIVTFIRAHGLDESVVYQKRTYNKRPREDGHDDEQASSAHEEGSPPSVTS